MDQQRYTWLLEKLQSPDDVDHWSAAERLAQLRTPEVVPSLVQHLTDSDFPVHISWHATSPWGVDLASGGATSKC